jgi:glycine dehydrogenase
MSLTIDAAGDFLRRHIGPRDDDIEQMLETLGYGSLSELMADAIPDSIRSEGDPDIDEAVSEQDLLARLTEIAGENKICRSFIGMGYSGTILPPVIQRNILENPGWYTQYTPYQAEICAGTARGASELPDDDHRPDRARDRERFPAGRGYGCGRGDDALLTARRGMTPGTSSSSPSSATRRRSRSCGRGRSRSAWRSSSEITRASTSRTRSRGGSSACCCSIPPTDGAVIDYSGFCDTAHDAGAHVVVATDLLSLTLLRPPGSSARTSRSGAASASAFPWGTADRTPPSWRRGTSSSGRCPAGSSASRWTPTATARSAWRSRRASSTSAAKRRRRTSARRRYSSRSSRGCTRSTTARRG